MKGIIQIKDETQERNFLEIDLSTLEKNDQRIEDLFEMIISESRKAEGGLSWVELKKYIQEKIKG
jgi:hypothetical protein